MKRLLAEICRGEEKNTTKTTTTESKSSLPGISAPANDFKEFYEVAADGGQRRANSTVPLGVRVDGDFGSLGKIQLRFALQKIKNKNILTKATFATLRTPAPAIKAE